MLTMYALFVHILKSKLALVTPNRLNVQTNLGKFEALSSTNFSKVGCGRLLATAALWVRIQTSLKIQSKGMANTFQPTKKNCTEFLSKVFQKIQVQSSVSFFLFLLLPLCFLYCQFKFISFRSFVFLLVREKDFLQKRTFFVFLSFYLFGKPGTGLMQFNYSSVSVFLQKAEEMISISDGFMVIAMPPVSNYPLITGQFKSMWQ